MDILYCLYIFNNNNNNDESNIDNNKINMRMKWFF